MSIVIDKKYKSYDYLCRYKNTPYYYHTKDKKFIFGTGYHLVKDITYSLYEVKPRDTWDSISLEFYNNPTYFWVLCDFNNVQDPYSKPEVGTKIKIPALSDLMFNTGDA